jgi:phosphatidylglycerophosphatase A
MKKWFILALAHGLGSGKIPIIPGTFGSMVGLGWLGLLLWICPNFWSLLSLSIGGVLASVSICSEAEEIIGLKDPGSIVLDEIVAIPFCYAPWVGIFWYNHQALPDLLHLFSSQTWPLAVLIFVCFRVLDMLKPWPLGPSQNLSGGWGTVMDDILAGLWIGLFLLGLAWIKAGATSNF